MTQSVGALRIERTALSMLKVLDISPSRNKLAPMKIAVLVKQTPDTETKAKLTASGLDLAGVKFILNPNDEFAVEEAIKLRDATKGEAVVVSLGPDRIVEAMRTALAMGCDSAVQVQCSEDDTRALDSFATAKALAAVLKQKGPFDLILTGKQAIDDDAMAVPQMVSAFLELPRVTVVTKLEIDAASKKVKANRAVEGGAEEQAELNLPCLIAAHKGLNNPRYASLPGIMKAKQKKVDVVPLGSLGVSAADAKLKAVSFELPPEKPPGKIFKGSPEELAAQIVHALRNEAKII
jgi:electron transfer flavoprotein beta subunit